MKALCQLHVVRLSAVWIQALRPATSIPSSGRAPEDACGNASSLYISVQVFLRTHLSSRHSVLYTSSLHLVPLYNHIISAALINMSRAVVGKHAPDFTATAVMDSRLKGEHYHMTVQTAY